MIWNIIPLRSRRTGNKCVKENALTHFLMMEDAPYHCREKEDVKKEEERLQYLVNAAQMRSYDRDMIENAGIPALVLMERAASATAEEIMRRFPISCVQGERADGRVLIVAGCGNNGGDGFATGRILQEHGYFVSYVLVGSREKCSKETAIQIGILERLGAVIESRLPGKGAAGIIVDALFGIGLVREVTGVYREAVEYINTADAFVVSADIPSGIHADTGAVMGRAVKADLTVTYGYRKLGLVFYPGTEYAGTVICRKIGIFRRNDRDKPAAFTYEPTDLAGIPARQSDGNKGSFGKVFIIAGSRKIYGASYLAALGAYRMGAGLVRVLTAEENRALLLSAVPEALVDTYGEACPESELEYGFSWADCVLVGPGIGTDALAQRMMEYVWKRCRLPLVVDADGLNILSQHDEWMEETDTERQIWITPHMGELSRLTKKSIKCCKDELMAVVKEYARSYHMTVIGKDARTVIADPSGTVYINLSGDSGMATGGSGDVLAGILAGLAAQGMRGIKAASMAVYVHGLAGNNASEKKTAYCVMAGDLLAELPEALTKGGIVR